MFIHFSLVTIVPAESYLTLYPLEGDNFLTSSEVADLEVSLHRREDGHYAIELRYRAAGGDSETRLLVGRKNNSQERTPRVSMTGTVTSTILP
jgi:hypothetical protein